MVKLAPVQLPIRGGSWWGVLRVW